MQKSLTILALVLISVGSRAQLKTFISLEAGSHWSLIKVDDRGSYFEAASILSSISGITIEQELFSDVSVSTGLYFQPYKTGINMEDSRRHQSRNEAYNALMIPIRLHYRVQPEESLLSFTPHVGYIYSINTLPENGYSSSGIISAPGGPAFSYTQAPGNEAPSGHLLELGFGVGLRFSGYWQASLNFSYLTGVMVNSASSFDLSYSDHQGINQVANYHTQGNGIYTSLSLQAPLSNVWQNKGSRERARIENSRFHGKSLERKGQLYLGGDLGSLWRLFYSSHPAISARPMEGRGVFRYANLHAGIYAGYMLSNELGLDLGFYYQRSSAFYSVMYDHEVDFTGKSATPFFMEVPLRFRYFYELSPKKIYLVAYGGPALLVHFSSGSSGGPAGAINYTDPAGQNQLSGTVSSITERPGRFRPLMRLGAGLEYRLPTEFPLIATAYVNYMNGFMETERIWVSSTVNEVPESSTVSWDGSGWSVEIGVKIPMSTDDRQDCVRLTRKK